MTYYDEPKYTEHCQTVQHIAQGDHAELVDARGLRDPALDPVLHRHLGTHYINAAANLDQPGLEGIIEDLCRALSQLFTWCMAQSQTGPYLIIAFLCNSGRHRSVMLASLLGHFLTLHRLHVGVRHLCSAQWDHLCGRNPPCQPRDEDWRTARWNESYRYFEDRLLKACYRHGFHRSEWWTDFQLLPFRQGATQSPRHHTMLPPRAPRFEEDARQPPG